MCGDGTSGLVFGHSIIDGHTVTLLSDSLLKCLQRLCWTVFAFAERIVDLVHGRGRVMHVVEATVERTASAAHRDGPSLDVLPKKLVFELPGSITDRIYNAFILEFKD